MKILQISIFFLTHFFVKVSHLIFSKSFSQTLFVFFAYSSHIVPNYCSKGKTLLIWSKAMLANVVTVLVFELSLQF